MYDKWSMPKDTLKKKNRADADCNISAKAISFIDVISYIE